MPPLGEAKKIADRQWQIGPYLIDIPDGVDDTETEAYRLALTAVHTGTQKWATTYKIDDYLWMIDGQQVALKHTNPDGSAASDTEEEARRVLAEAQNSAE